jgi:hypothetical protein
MPPPAKLGSRARHQAALREAAKRAAQIVKAERNAGPQRSTAAPHDELALLNRARIESLSAPGAGHSRRRQTAATAAEIASPPTVPPSWRLPSPLVKLLEQFKGCRISCARSDTPRLP